MAPRKPIISHFHIKSFRVKIKIQEKIWVYEVSKTVKFQLSLKPVFSCENYSLRENMGLKGVKHRENGNLRQSGREKSSLRKKNGV